ncbi:hypothetical protein SDC9_206302 [bioreactor metagenome]|uniref:Uncharacterized protein n=1 Tax=bioreactor metagenome TaxID=1076179 RepID=A0A645J4G3_9ZZZZ|nr:hypothetical protein [Anaerorhabdus sp.]MEA4875184.1 hypothetical protein [Anaerorhabdus sp.]
MTNYKVSFYVSIVLLFICTGVYFLNSFMNLLADNAIRILGTCMMLLIPLTVFFGIRTYSKPKE